MGAGYARSYYLNRKEGDTKGRASDWSEVVTSNGDHGVSYDDNSDNSSCQSEGSNHPYPSSPTFDHNEDDLGHLHGSNGCLLVRVRWLQPLWPLFQLDINNAFIYGDLSETVYMSLPDDYFDKNDNRVCRLKKSLYGLKQAPRQWNAKLTHALLKNGFIQSKSDHSLFTKSDSGMFLALLVYVNDIIINAK
ncbi:ribonuclease H-like domain-containing protein [Tanacetum coccineum]